jgi:hypothetical protein
VRELNVDVVEGSVFSLMQDQNGHGWMDLWRGMEGRSGWLIIIRQGAVMHAPTLESKRVVMRVTMYHCQFQMMKQR